VPSIWSRIWKFSAALDGNCEWNRRITGEQWTRCPNPPYLDYVSQRKIGTPRSGIWRDWSIFSQDVSICAVSALNLTISESKIVLSPRMTIRSSLRRLFRCDYANSVSCNWGIFPAANRPLAWPGEKLFCHDTWRARSIFGWGSEIQWYS
jgi:hypothetical protein